MRKGFAKLRSHVVGDEKVGARMHTLYALAESSNDARILETITTESCRASVHKTAIAPAVLLMLSHKSYEALQPGLRAPRACSKTIGFGRDAPSFVVS